MMTKKMTMMNKEAKLIVAMDVATLDEAKALVDRLQGTIEWVKVGSQLFTSVGPAVVEMMKEAGLKVFLDLKFHDIPATVTSAGKAAAHLGVDMFNVHALGGSAMLRSTAQNIGEYCEGNSVPKPIMIAVTILTSMNSRDLREININDETENMVLRLARMASDAGLVGVVSSAEEVRMIKQDLGSDFIVVTPGVRPMWSRRDDQKRIKTPAEAVRDGADYLVVGRPITKAPDPVEAARRITEEIATALE